MKTYMILNLVLFYISMCLLLNKTGFNIIQSFVPGLNIYNFCKVIKTNILVFVVLAVLIIFLPIRNIIATFLYVLMPYLVSYYYGMSNKVAFLTLLVPFIGYPYIAMKGFYNDTIY